MEMSEKLEKKLWSNIAELETVTPGTNPSIILKLLLYTDPVSCFPLILTHTHTQLVCTLAPLHPSLHLKHDVCVAKKWWGPNIKEKNKSDQTHTSLMNYKPA